jgi:hypothetical protein
MQWYVVVKAINGRRYLYRQKTYRVGKRVKTINQYIGPYDGRPLGGHPDLGGATTLPLPLPAPRLIKVSVAALLESLTDQANATEKWQKPWGDELRARNAVKNQPVIENMLEKLGVRMSSLTENGAYYSPAEDRVNVPDRRLFKSRKVESATSGYYSSLLHELVHWTKGPARTGRTSERTREGYSREELVAELGATMLMRHFGIGADNIAPHARYFQHWLGQVRDRQSAIEYAKREAEKAVQFILERGIMST